MLEFNGAHRHSSVDRPFDEDQVLHLFPKVQLNPVVVP